ncbi:EamA family transporter [Streptomyces sp. XM4193]|uniref:EamA family transporter n=1 Tax=Streptomyces sp. XM4193 TaxID=2929782 RepID=UPI001FF80C29|nr:EamA family transporter [Streptomyces sp. XM4193]MCK1795950.1 EamA family transporter [Streptomyces sp. XM4193]
MGETRTARTAGPPARDGGAGTDGRTQPPGSARHGTALLLPVLLVAGGLFSQQFGAAVAALLFPQAGAAGMVSLRLALSALVLLAFCRPAIRGYRREDWLVVAGFGLALGLMNMSFYQAIDRIPLGAAVTLEVLGPLALAVVAARRRIAWLWAGLALAGVTLLGRAGFGELNFAGVAFALGAAAMWAAYILFSARAGSRFPKIDGLALAMALGALISLPFGVAEAGATLVQPHILALGAGVALLSSVLPYSLELLALRRMPAATFAVLLSLAPAIAATAGFLVLGQSMNLLEVLAIALVVTASAGAVRTSERRPATGTQRGAQTAPRTEPEV